MSKFLQGKPCADYLRAELTEKFARLGKKPTIVAIGFEDPSWQQYANSLAKTAQSLGVEYKNVVLQAIVEPEEFFRLIKSYSDREDISGILLQQPLPKKYASAVEYVSPQKDVDCLSPLSIAKLYNGEPYAKLPATPTAVLTLLDWYGIDLTGKNVVIVGRGNAVGKPLALMILKRNATVTVCHTKTVNLSEVCKRADILISACGVAGLITSNFVTENTVVIDVGLSFVDGKTCGDVALDVYDKCFAVSPVPGGVGPITRLCLLGNLLLN